MKLQVGLDLRGNLPAFATLTESRKADSECAKLLALPKGSIVVCDRGYNDYSWYKLLTGQGSFTSPDNGATPLMKLLNGCRSCSFERHQ